MTGLPRGRPTLLPTVGVSARTSHTCALLNDGAVLCFGQGQYGRLGYGAEDDFGDDETPLSVGPIDLGAGAAEIAAGYYHSCAVVGGQVRCWGYNNRGQLGLGDWNNLGDDEAVTTAVTIALDGAAEQVSAGAFHTCAVLSGGAVRCWGESDATWDPSRSRLQTTD